MSLNKVSKNGNMYDWIDYTWNTVKGACPHACEYCFMRRWGKQPELHFDEKELKTDLGCGNFIFVGSSCDMWAESIPVKWIHATLAHCRRYESNRYLFQSKNPQRIYHLRKLLPPDIVVGTTIETNREYPEMGKAPSVEERAWAILNLRLLDIETMITIEPIMNFDLDTLVGIIQAAGPDWINIGANTNSKVKLPEPSPGKVKDLIEALQEFTQVKIKPNLRRLMK